ncbi:protein ORF-J [Elephant endotheliotropic herpesvirus 2]|nr:protein U45.7 [Elephant endotheliotropic herpesvirus 2]UEH20514.1 protein ORF-J [Elephant endotheliotropic herpesvirus 2]
MVKLKKVLKLFKKINVDCCNPNDEYINVNASTNSVIPTCDYMTKVTGGLPSLDSSYVHSKDCLCECPGSLVSPDLIDEKTTTIKSGYSKCSKKKEKKRCDTTTASKPPGKPVKSESRIAKKTSSTTPKKAFDKSVKLYIVIFFVCCTFLVTAILILKYLSIYIFKNDTVAYI